jgi:hypothetical protein
MKTRIVAAFTALILLVACSVELFAQKAKDKEEGYTPKTKVKEKRFEPVVKQNLHDYEGTYTGIDPTYVIEIRVGEDGKLNINSLEDNQKVTLANLKLEGAHMTATKIYRDGHREKFDATFSNRILNGVTAFGILVEGLNINLAGTSFSRVFYQLTGPPR